MSVLARYDLRLTLRSPFMFQGLANSRLGVDAAYLRNEKGEPIIPADQVRGMLRAGCFRLEEKKLFDDALFKRLFGEPSAKGTNDEPIRGALIAGDLAAKIEQSDDAQTITTTRIEIDDELGSVKSGALQVVELVARFGDEVDFKGELIAIANDANEAKKIETLFRRAIGLAPAIGAFKSAGFGEIVCACVALKEPPQAITLANGGDASERVAYRVTFDRPILVDAERVTDNLFVGSTIVPGAVFKGALAEKLKHAGVDLANDACWNDALAALRMSHAFPENDEGALSGFRCPLSLLRLRDDAEPFADALLHDLKKGDKIAGCTAMADGKVYGPLYPVDWKDKDFSKLFECGIIPKPADIAPQPRTHVAIDGEVLAASDQNLFTTVAQGVLRKDRETPRAWRVIVDFKSVDEKKRAQLQALVEGGLYRLGRTALSRRLNESLMRRLTPRIAERSG